MKLAQLHGPEDLRVDDVPEPPLEAGTVRVEVKYCAICGSDLHEYKIGPVPVRAEDADHRIPRSQWDAVLPKPMGHEIAGTVSEVGEGVDDVEEGDRVTINLVMACGECRSCAEGHYQLCEAMDGEAIASPGYAENLVVPAATIVPVPEGVSLRHAALTEPLSVSVHGVRRSGMGPGDTVAVFGAGSIGLGVVDAAHSAGAREIYVCEPREARREAALELGADRVIDPGEENARERILRETDGARVDVAFEAAGVAQALTDAMRSTKYQGTVVVMSVFEEEARIHPSDIMQAERNVVGSFAYRGGPVNEWSEYPAVLRMIEDGRLNPEPMISDVVALEDIVKKGFERLIDPDSDQVKILVEV